MDGWMDVRMHRITALTGRSSTSNFPRKFRMTIHDHYMGLKYRTLQWVTKLLQLSMGVV